MKHFLALAAVFVVATTTTNAFAQDAPPAEEAPKESPAAEEAPPTGDVVELNEAGIKAFTEGRFEDAASTFRKAYEIKPDDSLKKNEALAWFKASKCMEAERAANEYLALQPDDPTSVNEAKVVIVKCSVQNAQAAMEAKDYAKAEQHMVTAESNGASGEEAQAIATMRAEIKAEEERKAEEAALAAKKAEEERMRQEAMESNSQKKTLGLALASAGGAIVVGTLIYHMAMALGTAKKFKDTAAAGDDLAEYNKLGKKLETANWLVPTLYAVGAATGGVGAYFWLSADGGDTAAAAAGKTDKTIGVTFTWRF